MKEVFRVFNGIEMITNVVVGKFGAFYVNPGSKKDGLDENDSASLTRFNTKYHDNTPVMEFIGLIDKNGVNIFEGDICSHRFKRPWSTEMHTSTVVWNQAYCCYYLNDGVSNHRMRDDMEYEVIGNIHDNKELKP